MQRLFVALTLPDVVVDSLAQLQSGLPGARWTPEENLHLTLAFIGEVDRHLANEAASALNMIDAPWFEMRLAGLDFFGGDKPHSLWVGVDANEGLLHLQAKVDTGLRRAGLAIEKRKFTPHVTIARLSGVTADSAARFCAMHGLYSVGPFPVAEFHLVESRLGSEGSHYEVAATYPLGGAR